MMSYQEYIFLQHDKVATLLSKYIGKPLSQIDSLMYAAGSSLDLSPGILMNQAMRSPNLTNPAIGNNAALAYQVYTIPEMEKKLMAETAASAMEEFIRILQINEPMWIQCHNDGRYVLNHDNYDKLFQRANHFKTSTARVESSKDSGIVTISALHLVDMFLDAVSDDNSYISYIYTSNLYIDLSTAGNIQQVKVNFFNFAE